MPRFKYYRYAQPETFIGEYMKLFEDLETPHAYDFWCGVWILSNLVGRHVFVDRPSLPVWLNWYILLVAESGVTRKTTAVGRARKYLTDIEQYRDYDIEIVSTKIVPEMFENRLNLLSNEYERAHAAIAVDELVRLMGREQYTQTIVGLFTDMYDCPTHQYSAGTFARGKIELRRVFVTLLSASTPTWLMRAVNPDVIEGGFPSRCLFIVQERPKKKVAWPDGTIPSNDKFLTEMAKVNNTLKSLTQLKPETGIGISGPARRRFQNWYKKRTTHTDPFRASFEAREDEHVLRLAATLAISDGSWHIHKLHIDHAIQAIREVKGDASAIFEGTTDIGKFMLGVEKLREILMQAQFEGRAQSTLQNALQYYFNRKELQTILEIMHELGMVQQYRPTSGGQGRRPTMWRQTPKTQLPGMADKIVKLYRDK